MKTNKGFTLIELVVVIVILGILAAVAVPRFIDLSDQAENAALDGVAGAMASGMAINFAGCSAVGHDATEAACEAITDCNEVGNVLQGGVPDGYTAQAETITGNGTDVTCTVQLDGTTPLKTREFAGIGAGQ